MLSGLKSLEIRNHRFPHCPGSFEILDWRYHLFCNELTRPTPIWWASSDCAFTNTIYVTQACSILGFIYLSEGCPEKAESVMDRALDSAWEMQDDSSPEIRKALRVELALRQGMADTATS